MNLTRQAWVRKSALLTAVIVYLLFAAAIVAAQSDSGSDAKAAQGTARILISGKVVEPQEEKPNSDPIAKIILPEQNQQSKNSTADLQSRKINEPVQKLTRPVRPRPVNTDSRRNRTPGQADPPQLHPAINSTTVSIPKLSPNLGHAKSVEDRNATHSGNHPQVPRNQPSPVAQSSAQFADLPSRDKNQIGHGELPSQAIYYPSTDDRFKVIPVNVEADPELARRIQEVEKQNHFPNRDGFNMSKPLMPAPVELPGSDHKQQKVDPRVQEFLSSGEFLHDGGDRNLQVRVGSDWSVQGLDTEDTIGHFDTLDGQRIVTPSNRVSIYSPRFAAVQKISGLSSADSIEHMARVDDRTPTMGQGGFDKPTQSKQQLGTVRNVGTKSPSALHDRTRGLTVDNTATVFSADNVAIAQRIHNFLLTGYLNDREKPFLATAMQQAIAWSADMEVKVAVKNLESKSHHDVKAAHETITIDPRGNRSKLRVVKMADKRAAQPGEVVEFMIRFDNVGHDTIGNVTIMDNLTARLEYVEGSASCSVKADLITSQNDVQSMRLRWEIIDPLKIGEGGVIRFKCRVR